MIHCFVGTKAQFIKMAPVMLEMKNRNIPFRYVDSGQHAGITRLLRREFNVPDPDVSLSERQEDIVTIPSALGWYFNNLLKTTFQKNRLRSNVFPEGGICLIHGDTLSTLLGLQMACVAGLDVAHIEAGLRSHRMSNPFPEEMIRTYCMKRAQVLFTPSEEAAQNLSLMNVTGHIERLNGNTVADSLRIISAVPHAGTHIPEKPFALVTCHRLETITNKKRLQRVIALVNRVAEQLPVVFVMHEPTRRFLSRFGLDNLLGPNIRRLDLMGYADFIWLLRAAKLVVTDGGSIQEECGYLNKPCLVIRQATERQDGIGRNALLWMFDDHVVDRLLSQENDPPQQAHDLPRASAGVVDALIRLGYASCPADNRKGGQYRESMV